MSLHMQFNRKHREDTANGFAGPFPRICRINLRGCQTRAQVLWPDLWKPSVKLILNKLPSPTSGKARNTIFILIQPLTGGE